MEPREVLAVDEIPRPIEGRGGAFAALRPEKPLPFMPEVHIPELPLPRGPGYWGATRYDPLLEVGRTAAGVQRVLRQHDPRGRPDLEITGAPARLRRTSSTA